MDANWRDPDFDEETVNSLIADFTDVTDVIDITELADADDSNDPGDVIDVIDVLDSSGVGKSNLVNFPLQRSTNSDRAEQLSQTTASQDFDLDSALAELDISADQPMAIDEGVQETLDQGESSDIDIQNQSPSSEPSIAQTA
jgi:hypothetical protein